MENTHTAENSGGCPDSAGRGDPGSSGTEATGSSGQRAHRYTSNEPTRGTCAKPALRPRGEQPLQGDVRESRGEGDRGGGLVEPEDLFWSGASDATAMLLSK